MPRKKSTTDLSTELARLPMKTEPKCHVCQCASRQKVDKLIAAQFAYKSIAEELIASDDDFKGKELDTVRKNVERHAKKHVDIKSRAVREIVERRAREQGVLLDSADGQIASGRALLDLIITRGTEQLSTNPDKPVRMADAIEAVRMLEDVQKSEYMAQLEVLQRQVWAISQAVKETVPTAMLPQLTQRAQLLFEQPQIEIDK